MTTLPDRDDQVMSLMSTALALGAEERGGFLQVACDGDQALYDELRETLQWEERMGGFLRKPWMSLPELDRPFKPGQVINQRFEIIREIGHGGMGIVYEAFDRKRGQRIAIKSAKLGFRRLLSPELEAALKVRHRNICLVNEIHTAATEAGDIDFLTMELLEGPTLQARLAEGGRLEPEEALEIARQLCAGLAEAHRAGIIHKDLKPANIILSRAADGSSRAVITDFGLAGEPVPEAGDLAGTPRYMAPELWRGAAASKATDLYALGVILYEMVTGGTPFADEPSEARLTRRPPPPGTRVRHLDRRWDAAVVRCLDPSPAARPRDASELLASWSAPRLRKAPIAAAAMLLIIGAVALREPIMGYFQPASRLAMLPVAGTDDLVAIGNGALLDAAERLTRRSGRPTLVIIGPSRIDARATHEQLRQTVGATHALHLSLEHAGNDIVAHAELIDLATDTRLAELSSRYGKGGIGDLSGALAGTVSRSLQLPGPSAEPISAVAAPSYQQGLYFLRRDQHSFEQAIHFLQQAKQLDPHSPLPPAALAEALVLRNDGASTAQAERELQTAQGIDSDSVAALLAAGRIAAAKGDDEEALENYRRVLDREPRNIEVWLRIAEQYAKRRPEKAIECYKRAIDLDPSYYETHEELGVFYWDHANYVPAVEQFRKVIELAPRFYEAYTNLGGALSDMGDQDAAVVALTKSLSIKETAPAFNGLGAARAYQRRDAEAIPLYRNAIVLNGHSYLYLMNLGDSCRREGLAAEAQDAYRRGSEIALQVLQENPRSGRVRAYVGYLAARLGDRLRGEQEIDQALQLAPTEKTVLRRAVLTYEMLGNRDRALQIAATGTPDLLGELDRHPDLADFRMDPRFIELKSKREKGG